MAYRPAPLISLGPGESARLRAVAFVIPCSAITQISSCWLQRARETTTTTIGIVSTSSRKWSLPQLAHAQVYVIHDPAPMPSPRAALQRRDRHYDRLQQSQRDELQGVIATRSHIRNYDIRLLLMAVLVAYGHDGGLFRRLWTSGGRRSNSSDSKGGARFGGAGVDRGRGSSVDHRRFWRIIQLAVSRNEYLADATAVELTRYPQGLANALRKIAADPAELQNANRGTAHLYIANPKSPKSGPSAASHPPISPTASAASSAGARTITALRRDTGCRKPK